MNNLEDRLEALSATTGTQDTEPDRSTVAADLARAHGAWRHRRTRRAQVLARSRSNDPALSLFMRAMYALGCTLLSWPAPSRLALSRSTIPSPNRRSPVPMKVKGKTATRSG